MEHQEIIKQLEKRINSFEVRPQLRNVGRVVELKDGVVTLEGLSEGQMSEKILCKDKQVKAMILNLERDRVGAIVFGDWTLLDEGDLFESTGEVMSVGVSDEIIGRVVDALGHPIDGKGEGLKVDKQMLVDRIAPGVIERQPVSEPLHTGIMAIDAMIPIGRGQRELIIGDRNTGKTAVALDTIINQKNNQGPVICIYAAIGQKQARIAQVTEKLEEYGALDYTVVVAAAASDPAAMQYLAPYAATAIGEYFLEKGQDVLIVYDDLTKHAWAYRQLSLILRRPPGREAYPGDIFYLHSRLLERSCRLNENRGGGSLTALPIIETQFGDVSAYIPTNVISITDGQIYLETDLFNTGFRPAINAGNSVSRVGGAAQTKQMKEAAGRMRLDLAQFRELEAFTQFGSSDLDERTKQRLARGERIRELLKQQQYNPLSIQTQVALIHALNNGYLDEMPLDKIGDFKEKFELYMRTIDEKDPQAAVKDFFATYEANSDRFTIERS